MVTIAKDKDGNVVNSSTVYRLRKSEKRIDAREETYFCPHCNSQLIYAHSGKEGCFRHLKSTPKEVKEECPLYSGLLGRCPEEILLGIINKKLELQSFLDENELSEYKILIYYSEPALVRYIEKHPDNNFIMVGKMITTWEYDNLVEHGYLQLQKKALAKYLMSNKKPVIQVFVGTERDKIYLMKYYGEYFNDVKLLPYILSVLDLKTKNFSNSTILMQEEDILETRDTNNKHNNRRKL